MFNPKSLQKESCFVLETFANTRLYGYNTSGSTTTVLQLLSLVHLAILRASLGLHLPGNSGELGKGTSCLCFSSILS